MSEDVERSKTLWEGRGLRIGVYEHGFTVSSVSVVPDTNKGGEKNKSAGELRETGITYYSTLHDALKSVANRAAKAEASTLKEYVDTFERVSRELVSATKGQ